MLVMDELVGVAMVKGIKANYRKMAALQGTTLEKMEEEMKQQIRDGTCRSGTVGSGWDEGGMRVGFWSPRL